jgi:hypothetical protein
LSADGSFAPVAIIWLLLAKKTTAGNLMRVITLARVSFWPLSRSPPNLERVMNLQQV